MLQYFSSLVEDASSSQNNNDHENEISIYPLTNDKRIVVCGFLGNRNKIDALTYRNRGLTPIAPQAVLDWIEDHHGKDASKMVWNLSGEKYDYSLFDDQVVEYNLGLLPAPPLALLETLVDDILRFYRDDKTGIAILHDLSGRRCALVAACCIYELSGDSDAIKHLHMGRAGENLVPSQHRYFGYFKQRASRKLSGGELQRIIVNGIPDFVNDSEASITNPIHCRPFMKVFSGTEVIAGTTPGEVYSLDDVSFTLVPLSPFPNGTRPAQLENDILIRVYHHHKTDGKNSTMFAFQFHAGFIQDCVLRLAAEEIDGAVNNGRFPKTFFVDIIFKPVATVLLENHSRKKIDTTPNRLFSNILEERVSSSKKSTVSRESEIDDTDALLNELELITSARDEPLSTSQENAENKKVEDDDIDLDNFDIEAFASSLDVS